MAITPSTAQLAILRLNQTLLGTACGTTVMAAALPSFPGTSPDTEANAYAQYLIDTTPALSILTTQQVFEKVLENISASDITAADKAPLVEALVAFVNAGLTVGATVNLLSSFLYNNAATLDNVWANTANQVKNQTTVASFYTLDQGTAAASSEVLEDITEDADTVDQATDPLVVAGQTFTLTTGVDTVAGTTGDDTINATNTTVTGLDTIAGGLGNDTMVYNDIAGGVNPNTALPVVTSVETVNVRSGGAADITTTAWTGTTAVNVTQGTTSTVTVAATTAVAISGLTGAAIVVGGSTQTVTAVGQADLSDAAGAITATISSATAGQTNTIKDGTSVNVVVGGLANDGATSVVAVGTATEAPTGAVTVSTTGVAYTAGLTATLGDVAVVGGSTVTVTETATTAAGLVVGATDTGAGTITLGDVSVTGGAATTAVTVNQDAANTAVNYVAATTTTAATPGEIGVVDGAVTIADKNAASATVAGTIAAVTLNNYGAATIDSSALTTVSIQGTGGTLGISRGALTATPTANTLALNITSATVAAITDSEAAAADDGFTTINITTAGTASTVANLTAADARTLTVGGTGAVTFTAAALLANTTAVTVTNTGATTFGTTTLNVASTFTSGAGAESVILGATTKAIATGAGNDTVSMVSGTTAITGTIDAGDDTDTLVMVDADAVTATATETFEGKISNFERLSLTGATAANQTVNLANLDNINYISVGGVNVGNTLTLSNVATGVTVNANAGAAGTIDVTQATNGTADTINFGVSATTAKTVFKLDASEYETIAITTDDSATTATSIAHIITTLDATAATALTIAGDAGLTVGTLTGTALTSINASGVTAGAVTLTTGALAGASTISGGAGNDTLNAASAVGAVTLSGNAGNDTLTGGAAVDTIDGGAGNDWIYGNQGADNLTGGTGADIFAVTTAAHSNGVNVDTIADFTVGTDKIATGIGAANGETISYLGEANAYGAVLTSFTGVDNEAVLDTSTNTLYIDVDGSQTLDALDIAIEVGVSDLSQSDFATLGTTGADAILLNAGIDVVYSLGGADTITAVANTTAIAALSTDTLSIATTGMDIINAVASATIDLTAPLTTEAGYDTVTNAAAGAVITKTVTAGGALTGSINQFVGLYDYVTGTFTSTATTAAASTSTTDVAASLFLYATADATTADEGIILIGSVANATALNGVLTLA